MIQASVIFYQDGPDLLRRCLQSLKGKVDSILAIDGRWQGFKADSTNSTDGCTEVAKELADEVITTKQPWFNQVTKRNAIFTSKADFHFWIDADEYVEGFIDESKLDKDFYNIKLIENDTHAYTCRLFRNIKGLKFKKKHSWLWLNDKIVNQESNISNIFELDTIRIIHKPNDRPIERQAQDAAYIAARKEPVEFPQEQYVKTKEYPMKDTTIECLHGVYNGFDFDSVWFQIAKGQTYTLSRKKALELVNEKDYNNQFRIKD